MKDDIELIHGAANIIDPRMDFRINHDERVDMADAIRALADRLSQPVEAVAWQVYVAEHDKQYVTDDPNDLQMVDDVTNHCAEVTPLFAKPFPASAPAGVPDMKEVPDTLDSYDDMGGYWYIGYAEGWNDCRESMLTAAPTPQDSPAQPEQHKCVFEKAIDLQTLDGWQECACGRKKKCGFPYYPSPAQGE